MHVMHTHTRKLKLLPVEGRGVPGSVPVPVPPVLADYRKVLVPAGSKPPVPIQHKQPLANKNAIKKVIKVSSDSITKCCAFKVNNNKYFINMKY